MDDGSASAMNPVTPVVVLRRPHLSLASFCFTKHWHSLFRIGQQEVLDWVVMMVLVRVG